MWPMHGTRGGRSEQAVPASVGDVVPRSRRPRPPHGPGGRRRERRAAGGPRRLGQVDRFALACGLAGFDLLGDDAVGTEHVADGFVGHACYSTVRFDDGTLHRLPALAAHHRAPERPADRNKHLAPVRGDARPTAGAAGELPIDTRWCCRWSSGRVRRGSSPPRRLPPSAGWLPARCCHGLGAGSLRLAHMAELVRRTPCYELQLGARVDDVPMVVGDLLSELPG